MNKRLTAVIQSEGDGFVAFCPELDIASQGSTIQEARDQLREALELFFECASQAEIAPTEFWCLIAVWPMAAVLRKS